jgi:hypothetical protein
LRRLRATHCLAQHNKLRRLACAHHCYRLHPVDPYLHRNTTSFLPPSSTLFSIATISESLLLSYHFIPQPPASQAVTREHHHQERPVKMSGQSPPGSPTTSQRRRSSFAELFTPRPSTTSSTTPPSTSVPSSLATPQHRRGLSISTSTKGLGLSGATPEQSPFTAFAKQRQASVSTASSTGSPEFRNSFGDEPAVVEEDDPASAPLNTPASPSFARRMSFGAQALRDVKQGSVGASSGGRRPSSSLFTWNENTTSSIPSPSPPGPSKSATARGKGRGLSSALPISQTLLAL